jgi:divinyl protochlorophyllide a 8-vinyl-reductase
MPACDYYAATFERLFTVLVHPDAKVVETDCMGRGASACRFEIRWR